MKKLHKSQRGFSSIELLLLLLLILLLIFLGWYVWSQKDKNKPESSNNTPAKTEQKKQEPAKAPASAPTYLKIPEWGIKVKLSDNIKDAYYDKNISTDMEAFSLRVKSLDNEADCKNGAQSVAAIFKVGKNQPDPQDETKTYPETQKGVTIGNDFYFINVAQYYCSEDKGVQTTLDKIRTAFTQASSQIEKL